MENICSEKKRVHMPPWTVKKIDIMRCGGDILSFDTIRKCMRHPPFTGALGRLVAGRHTGEVMGRQTCLPAPNLQEKFRGGLVATVVWDLSMI